MTLKRTFFNLYTVKIDQRCILFCKLKIIETSSIELLNNMRLRTSINKSSRLYSLNEQ